MAKIGVCLSGCGVNDGAEIHESVITALTLDRMGAKILYTAPNVEQTKVVNHLTGDEMNESRNVLVESARIARGNITDLAELTSDDLDGLIFPGGYGAALNLCDFAIKGAKCDIHPEVNRIIQEMIMAKKPVGVICIAPVALARALVKQSPIFVIDEATRYLDTETESDIRESLSNSSSDRITIVISHRLASIHNSNKIIVLEDGKITTSGTHEDLLQNSPMYASLWKAQSTPS